VLQVSWSELQEISVLVLQIRTRNGHPLMSIIMGLWFGGKNLIGTGGHKTLKKMEGCFLRYNI